MKVITEAEADALRKTINKLLDSCRDVSQEVDHVNISLNILGALREQPKTGVLVVHMSGGTIEEIVTNHPGLVGVDVIFTETTPENDHEVEIPGGRIIYTTTGVDRVEDITDVTAGADEYNRRQE